MRVQCIGCRIHICARTHVVGWVEGVAILSAVVLVISVNAINDYRKDLQFRKLNESVEERNVRVSVFVPENEVTSSGIRFLCRSKGTANTLRFRYMMSWLAIYYFWRLGISFLSVGFRPLSD